MLDVWVTPKVVGSLDRHPVERGAFTFAYRPSIDDGNDVSLTMPWSLESYHYKRGLHPVFQMNLPEGRLRESIELSLRKRVEGFDSLSLLEVVGRSQIGRLRFANDPEVIDQVPLQRVAELVAYDGTEDLLRDLLERFSMVSGVSGVQPKVLIRDQEQTDAEPYPLGQSRVTVKGATHIVKGWNANEYPHLAANEFFCMSAARLSGLEVPDFFLSENNQFLVVRRFDLTQDGVYLGFEDFCSLNGVDTSKKYDGSYEKLAKRICQFVSPALQASALEAFFRSFSLSCVVRNGDAHLKNFGVLYGASNRDVHFAPAFDIVSTTAYLRGDSLALTLDGSKRFPTMKRLIAFAHMHCNLQPARAKLVLEEVANAVAETVQGVRRHISDYPDFKPVGESMLGEWNKGLDALT
ncbi:MAG: type II toxin-antitoxin system HipA family toxin [Chlorobiaceae bacterium]